MKRRNHTLQRDELDEKLRRKRKDKRRIHENVINFTFEFKIITLRIIF